MKEGASSVFNNLHPTLKGAIILLVIIIPFWYLSIYVFEPHFISEKPIQIPITLSFCLSVCTIILSFIIVVLIAIAFHEKFDMWKNVMVNSGMISIITISISLYSSYIEASSFMKFGEDVVKNFIWLSVIIGVAIILRFSIEFGLKKIKQKWGNSNENIVE